MIKYEELRQGDLVRYRYRTSFENTRGFGIIISRIKNPRDPFEQESYDVYMINEQKHYMIHQASIVKVE